MIQEPRSRKRYQNPSPRSGPGTRVEDRSPVESYADRVVLVTGACGGIGEATSRAFARAGASLVLCDVRADRLAILAGDLGQMTRVSPEPLDVTDESAIRAVYERIAATFGSLDVLINTVGVVDNMGDVETLETEVWRRSIEINLTSAFLMAKHGVRLMKGRGGGVIANISSVSGLANQAGAMVYSVTKAGLISLTKSEAIDLAPLGIRAVAICPGSVSTQLVDRAIELTAEQTGRTPAEQRREWESQYPSGRFSTPDEVADLTLFLCSGRAANISGAAVVIDGGLTALLPER
jgi:NAD(P)-dependent dehydrogenase (short-subunit alcohol dehydrogenase family)